MKHITFILCNEFITVLFSFFQIYLSHNKKASPVISNKVEMVSGIERVDGKDIILRDGKIVNSDVILLATGYRCVPS